MKEFKIRSSAIGQIMTNARSKSETLSATTKTFLEDWVKEQIFERRKEISSKYLDKGNIMEDESIDFLAEQLGLGMLVKNEESFENDYLTGTPDVITDDLIIDVKNSWDCFTFPMFDTELKNKAYYWQLQGYMYLTGKKSAQLVYTLMDTPKHLIDRERKYHCLNNGIDVDDEGISQDFINKMTYSNVADKYRIKVFDVERNDDDIEKIIERVKECREYIKEILF